MRGHPTVQFGFSLIELMITLGIISVLAGVAIPNFYLYVVRAKTTEAILNTSILSNDEIAYFQKPRIDTTGATLNPCFLRCPANPPGPVTSYKRDWQVGGGYSNFDVLGFNPGGQVYFSYLLDGARIGGLCPDPLAVRPVAIPSSNYAPFYMFGVKMQTAYVIGIGDLNGNGNRSWWIRNLDVTADGDPIASDLMVVNEFE